MIHLMLAWPAGAEEAGGAGKAPDPVPAVTAYELGRGSPRGAVQGYLAACREKDYEKAARFLDLSRIQEDGPTLARQLRVVLSRTLWIDVEGLSQEPSLTSPAHSVQTRLTAHSVPTPPVFSQDSRHRDT
jgi:MscS family membrane protein